MVAVEVDGGSHFTWGYYPPRILGSTVVRDALVRLHGINVLGLRADHFIKESGSIDEQLDALRRGLEAVGVPVEPPQTKRTNVPP